MLGVHKMLYPQPLAPVGPTGAPTGGSTGGGVGGTDPVILPATLYLSQITNYSSTYANVAWSYIAGTNSVSLKTYTLYMSINGGAYSSVYTVNTEESTRSYMVTGLSPNVAYSFYVTATDATSNVQSITLTSGTPGMVTNISIITSPSTPGSVTIAWQPPADTGGLSIVSYNLDYGQNTNAVGIPILGIAATQITLNGLPGGTTYFRVQASNGLAVGPWTTAPNIGYNYIWTAGVQQFTSNGTFNKPSANCTQLQLTIVGGGGGGGYGGVACGGGGAGEVILNLWNIDSDTSWPIVVGAGGAPGASGGDSSFGGFVANGGGAGGVCVGANAAGEAGGSGGGGSAYGWPAIVGGGSSVKTGPSGTSYGNAGGNAWTAGSSTLVTGGGGGGANGAGGTNSVTVGDWDGYLLPGNGGAGSVDAGTVDGIAGGGGAVFLNYSATTTAPPYEGIGGLQGLGNSGAIIDNDNHVIRYAGDGGSYGSGGGGGAVYNSAYAPAGSGKQGIVIVRYVY